MAFHGCEFVFDGVSCSEYGLMVYDFGSTKQSDVSFPSAREPEVDRVAGRYDSLFYGLEQSDPLEFTLVFGANMESIDANEAMDRPEIERIAAWLTGHERWKWLSIVQDDMEGFRYKCVISNLKLITQGQMPWAFSCTVTCDSPYAYTYPIEKSFSVNGTKTVVLHNRSSHNGFYKPKCEITINDSGDFSVTNESDGKRTMAFSALPTGGAVVISVDNQNQIITNDRSLNFYPYFNMKFLRLRRGDNVLTLKGNGTIKFICEYPVNIGG